MLPKLSVAKLKKLSGRHIIIIGLLALHTFWIITHLTLVSKGLINPWKLGGYGMYTKPNYRAKLSVFDISSKQVVIPRAKYKSSNFRDANLRYVFRCRQFNEEVFLVFFQDNPHLANRDLRFVLREKVFSQKPVAVKRETYSAAEIHWPQKDQFTYRGEICGTEYSGAAEYKPKYKL